MNRPIKTKGKCNGCGKQITATVFESVNTDFAKDLPMQIMSGDLFSAKCPHCKTISYVEYDLLYHDINNSAKIWVLHKNAPKYKERISEIRSAAETSHKLLRIVGSMNELTEKVSCLEKKRDDRIVECYKSFIIVVLLFHNPELKIKNIFYTAVSGKEMFHVVDSDGDDECIELSEETYEFIKGLYFSSPYAAKFDDNYAIVDFGWAMKVMGPLLEAKIQEREATTKEKPDDATQT